MAALFGTMVRPYVFGAQKGPNPQQALGPPPSFTDVIQGLSLKFWLGLATWTGLMLASYLSRKQRTPPSPKSSEMEDLKEGSLSATYFRWAQKYGEH
jgi:hypothetical protein